MELKVKFEQGSAAENPIFILVHGKAGHLDIMRIFNRSLPADVHTLYVEAPYRDKRGGFSWWDTDLPEFPREQFESSLNLLSEVINSVEDAYQITPRYTGALGFSQGSGMLTHLVLTGKITLEKLAVLAGFVKWPEEVPQSQNSATQIFWGHGTADDVVKFSRAQKDVARLKELGYSVSLHSDEVGHKLGSTAMRALKEFCSDS